MSREVMEISLEALLLTVEEMRSLYGSAIEQEDAIEALRATLAQPEPEPVAWMHKFIDDVITKNRPTDITRNAGRWTALYTVPPQRKPLSDDELLAALKSVDSETARLPNGFKLFARAIEAAHGIGEEK